MSSFFLRFLFIFIPFYSIAQQNSLLNEQAPVINLPFERLTINNGLSQGMVRSIIQDSKGYMWFSTKDGLNKYDGYNITVYRNDPRDSSSIPDNEVSVLLEDPNGNLWVGTNTKGLCLFDRQAEKFYRVPTGNMSKDGSYEDLRSMQYKNGKLFLGFTLNVQILDVHKVMPGNYHNSIPTVAILFTTQHIKPGHVDEPFRCLVPDDTSVLIRGADSCFILKEKSDHFFDVTKKFSLQHPVGTGSLTEGTVEDTARQQYYLVSSYGSDDDIHVFDHLLGTGDHTAFRAFKDATGKIWILGNEQYQNMLYQFDPSSNGLVKIGSPDGEINRLLKSTISFCVDKNGIVWLGTGAYGVIKFDSRMNRFKNNNLCSIYYLNFDKGGRLNYFPTGHRVNPATFDLQDGSSPKELIPGSLVKPQWRIGDVTSIVTGNNGHYWMVMCYDIDALPDKPSLCLLEYDPVTRLIRQHIKNKSPAMYNYRNVIKDKEGGLWIFGNDRNRARVLLRYDEQQDKIVATYRFPVNNGVDNYPFVSDWWQEAEGAFWFATRQGLFRFNEKTNEWKYYHNNPYDSSGIPSDKLLSLCPDPRQPGKYLWIGTEGSGFCRFGLRTGKCIRFTEKDGLPNNVVYGILGDDNGNLWMSTNHGLSCFTPPSGGNGNTDGIFINFTKSDGIQDNEFNRFSFRKAPTGELVFGGVNGITWFRPGDVLKKDDPPTLVFTSLSVFNKVVDHKTSSSIIQQPIDYAVDITLPFNQNMFTISFAALEYSSDDKKRYKYFLEGFDRQWINNGSKNEATYTNLDPGKYIFHVMAAGRAGIWDAKDRTLTVIIKPPWWATLWFKCVAIMAAAALIYATYLYRLKQALKVQKMRNRIASDLHDEIGSTLSSISLSSTVIQHKLNGDPSEVKDLLKQISSNTDNMMEAMNDIVWSINTRNDGFDNITTRMREFAAGMLEPLDCSFHLAVHQNTGHIKLDMQQRKNLYLIFKEAINNAAKYSGCKNLWVDIGITGNKKLFMRIKDDGRGFVPQAKGKKSGARTSQGNGLVNMRNRAGELKGSISIDTAPGKGTILRLECIV